MTDIIFDSSITLDMEGQVDCIALWDTVFCAVCVLLYIAHFGKSHVSIQLAYCTLHE